MLIHSSLLRLVKNEGIGKQYNYLLRNLSQDRFMLNDTSVFGTKRYYAGRDVQKFIHWVNQKIVLRIGQYEYESIKTYDVLLRIATGMLNKLDLSKEEKIEMHDNMVKNVHRELNNVMFQSLPF